MIFNDITYYLLFLIPAVVLFHLAGSRARLWILSAFGFAFFVYYSYRHFGGAAGALCGAVFLSEIAITRLYRRGSRWCLVGIAQALGVLIGFKYRVWLATLVGISDVRISHPLGIVQVLGISFFTFEFIHYAVDVYVGRITERPKVATYAAFILFFPTMVAGPIKRFQNFSPQAEGARFDAALASQGITRICAGLAKKHVLADVLAFWSDKLSSPELFQAPRLTIFGWLLAYAFRIYFDFSAYSDIAIGSSNLFGFRVPENFNWPYLSRDIAEFWQRWHISLGRWIYDYVFAPLAIGARVPVPLALLVTFTLCGLWHGANGHFAIWGAWHGLLLATFYVWRTYVKPRGFQLPAGVGVALTFSVVLLGYALFALETSRALYVIGRVLGIA